MARYRGEYFQYYDEQCYPNKYELSLPGGRTPEDELAKHKKEKREKERILEERQKLREMLRKVRRLYAQLLGCPDGVYLVFHDSTLDDLTLKMPRNRTEMMGIHGMGLKRFQNIGTPLLQVIARYLKDEESSTKHSQLLSIWQGRQRLRSLRMITPTMMPLTAKTS